MRSAGCLTPEPEYLQAGQVFMSIKSATDYWVIKDKSVSHWTTWKVWTAITCICGTGVLGQLEASACCLVTGPPRQAEYMTYCVKVAPVITGQQVQQSGIAVAGEAGSGQVCTTISQRANSQTSQGSSILPSRDKFQEKRSSLRGPHMPVSTFISSKRYKWTLLKIQTFILTCKGSVIPAHL